MITELENKQEKRSFKTFLENPGMDPKPGHPGSGIVCSWGYVDTITARRYLNQDGHYHHLWLKQESTRGPG